ncbi:MAG: VPLPA-CTERM sorting domain-containing protein, partial [Gammaproteobacteria bacterium]|nr:VPLPA-CTERM sorting domain-containing protein [Gammaproteobacteria bacterium]
VSSNVPSGTLVDNNNLVRAFIGAPGTGNNTQSIFWGANGSNSTLTVTQNNGYGFDLNSFDASSLYNSAGTLTVTGYTATSGIVTQNFVLGSSIATLNITGMDALNTLVFSFDGTAEFAPYDLDNITLTLVPVPAAVWLMGSALGILFVGRRKKV